MLGRLATQICTNLAPRQPGRISIAASLLIALLAVPIILACGATPAAVTTAPASALKLDITIQDQHVTPRVTVAVSTLLANQRTSFYRLSASHTLTCNGVGIPLAVPGVIGIAQVPRQPPGGAYTFVYTDEHGQRTTLVVPVLRSTFAVTSPAAGATITLPRQPSFGPSPTATGSAFTTGASNLSALAAVDATPVPPATPTPSATPIPSGPPTPVGQVRPPELVSQPPILIRYTVPTIPTDAIATFQATASAKYCGPNSTPSCDAKVGGPALAASGAYALTDVAVAPGYGFEAFGPGPGEVDATLTMSWALPPSGFNAARVSFVEDESVQIVWAK